MTRKPLVNFPLDAKLVCLALGDSTQVFKRICTARLLLHLLL